MGSLKWGKPPYTRICIGILGEPLRDPWGMGTLWRGVWTIKRGTLGGLRKGASYIAVFLRCISLKRLYIRQSLDKTIGRA